MDNQASLVSLYGSISTLNYIYGIFDVNKHRIPMDEKRLQSRQMLGVQVVGTALNLLLTKNLAADHGLPPESF